MSLLANAYWPHSHNTLHELSLAVKKTGDKHTYLVANDAANYLQLGLKTNECNLSTESPSIHF